MPNNTHQIFDSFNTNGTTTQSPAPTPGRSFDGTSTRWIALGLLGMKACRPPRRNGRSYVLFWTIYPSASLISSGIIYTNIWYLFDIDVHLDAVLVHESLHWRTQWFVQTVTFKVKIGENKIGAHLSRSFRTQHRTAHLDKKVNYLLCQRYWPEQVYRRLFELRRCLYALAYVFH